MTRLSSLPFLAALLVGVAACDREAPTASPPPEASLTPPVSFGLGGPLGMLNFDQRRLFARGRVVFNAFFSPDSGLGPLFNGRSCAECHEDPVPGGIGDEVETHASAFVGGVCSDLAAIGGPVVQDSVTPLLHAALGIDSEPMLTGATGVGHRTSIQVMGLGLVDAVPDAELLARADPDDRNQDGISGRAHMTASGRVGRFGRKAQIATLREFVAGAFVNEMGITSLPEPNEPNVGGNPLPPGTDPTPDPELSQQDLDAATAFMVFLAPPTPRTFRFSFGQRHARFLFRAVGCAGCHTPTLFTGPNAVFALRFRAVNAFSDFLLHDMGPDLADICLGQAVPEEFRTEPLMGLRFKTEFLHDGRAASIDEAIRLHGGEASRARDRFIALSVREQTTLLQFLAGL
jgi:CxxC motif-containing protein (DUF1111 family)